MDQQQQQQQPAHVDMGIRIRHAENMCCVLVISIKSSNLVDITNVDNYFNYQINLKKK